jgi:tetratricopeptide (TPR) repeat protein
VSAKDVSSYQAVAAALFVLCTVAAFSQTAAPPAHGLNIPSYRPSDLLNDTAFERFYSLDYDTAIRDFEKIVSRHPDAPFAINHLISAVLMRELYRMGAMNTVEYANDSFVGQKHQPPDPATQERIKSLVQRAEDLEAKQLAADGNNVDALYARGVTRATFALYTALVERAWYAALRNAVGARHDHERVLQLSPGYTDAKLVVGAHNYIVGSLPWAVKMGASLVGLGGSKEKGLEYLRQASESNGETSIDAKVVLTLFLRREHRYDEALTINRDLIARYPQNGLFAIEEGNLLRSAGHKTEAQDAYRRVLQAGRQGKYPGVHYEMAALSLGDILRGDGDYNGAAAAYDSVRQVPHPDPELLQKADLAAGEMYDMQKKRDLAVKKYQAVIAANSENAHAEMARKYLVEPYRPD